LGREGDGGVFGQILLEVTDGKVMKYAFVRLEGQGDIRLDIRTAEDAENSENEGEQDEE
jgi:hypothetical protein